MTPWTTSRMTPNERRPAGHERDLGADETGSRPARHRVSVRAGRPLAIGAGVARTGARPRLLPRGRRRDALRGVLSDFTRHYEDRILPVDEKAAVWAARFRAEAREQGCPLDLGDALIAGTAKACDLSVATRNATDFGGLELVLTNPWEFR